MLRQMKSSILKCLLWLKPAEACVQTQALAFTRMRTRRLHLETTKTRILSYVFLLLSTIAELVADAESRPPPFITATSFVHVVATGAVCFAATLKAKLQAMNASPKMESIFGQRKFFLRFANQMQTGISNLHPFYIDEPFAFSFAIFRF